MHLRKFRIPLLCAAAFCALVVASPGIRAVEDGEPPSPTRHAAVNHQYQADETNASGSSHEGEKMIIPFMLAFVVILMAAKVGGDIFERIGQPAVLGELVIGVILGNLGLFGVHALETIGKTESIEIAAQIGVIILLFEVGLESHVDELLSVGLSSFLVAVIGVVAPMLLGYGVGVLLLPDEPVLLHVFLGATLAATSVGITARVLKDLRKTQTREAQIVLGAAVIDDVLGLIVLAVITGLIQSANSGQGESVSMLQVGSIIGKAVLFLFGSLVLGRWLAEPLLRTVSHMKVRGVMMASSISICFLLAAVAGLIGLAPIVGAFAAGLILEGSHFGRFVNRGERPVEEQISPVSDMFVPIFFVLMGFRVELRTFVDPAVIGLASALTVVAILGKLVSSLGAIDRGLRRMIISVGMIPRGEVGLIFASIGASMVLAGERVVNGPTYSAIVVMVVITTLITPVWLKQLYSKTKETTRETRI